MTLRTVDLGTGEHSLNTTAFGYGAMSLAGVYGDISEDESLTLLHALYDRGVRFFDTANIYGSGLSENILSRFLTSHRHDVAVATKCGIVPKAEAGRRSVNGRPEHIREQIDLSLRRLGTEAVDLYYLHRPDPEVPIEESTGALADLVEAGKVRRIGLSEATGEEIRRAHKVHPLTAVQSEWSLFARDVERYVIPACADLGIGFVAFSPVARGLLTDSFRSADLGEKDVRRRFPWFSPENLRHNLALGDQLRSTAAGVGLSAAGLALAWLYAKARSAGLHLSVIPGTRYLEHADELLSGVDVAVDTEVATLLDDLADHVKGDRSFDPMWVSGGREGLLPRES